MTELSGNPGRLDKIEKLQNFIQELGMLLDLYDATISEESCAGQIKFDLPGFGYFKLNGRLPERTPVCDDDGLTMYVDGQIVT